MSRGKTSRRPHSPTCHHLQPRVAEGTALACNPRRGSGLVVEMWVQKGAEPDGVVTVGFSYVEAEGRHGGCRGHLVHASEMVDECLLRAPIRSIRRLHLLHQFLNVFILRGLVGTEVSTPRCIPV
jgi:hypothetical protein